MTAPYDIFKTDQDGSVLWCGATETLEDAEAQVKKLAQRDKREFIIFDQNTGNRVVIGPGGSSVTPREG